MTRVMVRLLAIAPLALATTLGATTSWVAAQAPVAPQQQPPSPPASQPPQPGAPTAPSVPPDDVEAGRRLFEVACSSCHGPGGVGSRRGPSLLGVGAASADFYLSTGRMPLDRPRAQAERKPPAYSAAEIRRLTAYVASLRPGTPLNGPLGPGTPPNGPLGPGGPPIPLVDPRAGDLVDGNRLYAINCASCHNSAASGGALGHAVYAPPLAEATPLQIAEAIRIGPGSMPVFGPDTLDDRQVNSIVRYVDYLQHPRDRGGYGLGHLGPIPEGFVAWVIGLGALLLIARWIGTTD